MAALRLDTPVKFLKGVGERRADALERLGIRTANDLLNHLPHRYVDASTITPLANIRIGDDVACIGQVVTKAVTPTRRGLRIFSAVLRDASGVLECTWPGQPFLDRAIAVGQTLLVTGPVRKYRRTQLVPREFVILGDDADAGLAAGVVLPVYPATDGVSHRLIRALILRHLDPLIAQLDDAMPAGQRAQLALPTLQEALQLVHAPATVADAEHGRRRLAFDELFDLQLTLARARAIARRSRRDGVRFELRQTLTSELKTRLPWALTGDQRHALREISADMVSDNRMHRLLLGDVGTGKTVIALFAMLIALENEYQAVMMAPTELLADQHAHSIARMLSPLGIMPEVLVGKLSASEKSASRRRIRSGGARIIVGTHALLQETVDFHRLGLVVIDEQHRFGVQQRSLLVGKGAAPDVLLLSATPIPRSLALTRYGDLDISVLRERPPGRGTVRTAIRGPRQREAVLDFVATECRSGRQAYVVLPMIDESDRLDVRVATTMAQELAARWPDLEVGLVHGRLPAEERDATMRRFRQGDVQALVATTVIEVGVDVPNATVMLIEHPERFGLAQLHQLRGRVGRGGSESFCIVLAARQIPERLRAFAATDDGFRIAELDLQERGMGELTGVRQSGGFELRQARLPDDEDLLTLAHALAADVIAADPALLQSRHKLLRTRVLARYPRAVDFFRTG